VRHALRCGATRDGAAKYAKISRATFYEWLARGETGEEPHAAFLDMVWETEGTKEIRAARQLRLACEKGERWAVEFMLSRRCGWTDKTSVTVEDATTKLDAEDATELDIARAVVSALESRLPKPEGE
jgi:transposase